jgi:hypothetical protein
MSWGKTIGRRFTGIKRHRHEYGGGFVEVFHHDLHPTKGWRLVKHFMSRIAHKDWLKTPLVQRFWKRGLPSLAYGTSDAGRWMRNRDVLVLRPQQVDLMAHGWYRRKMKLEEA